MVEAEEAKFATLRVNYRNLPQVALVHTTVVGEGPSSIAGLVEAHSPTSSVQMLSIDVDGLDFELLSTLKGTRNVRPEVIVAESNAFVRPDLKSKLGMETAMTNMQQSLWNFQQLGVELGYTLVCFTQNAIFLRTDLLPKLEKRQGGVGPRGVKRLYFEALLVNWNDMQRNVNLTRRGRMEGLVSAEEKEFGVFEADLDLEVWRRRAEAEEQSASV
mmetsp:Transcript_1570/g.3773  ORF Transcript_1570/g.3773 Transcript_1570/m.3773 type:complete len:216 (+) Transcript_1570:3-650(+)